MGDEIDLQNLEQLVIEDLNRQMSEAIIQEAKANMAINITSAGSGYSGNYDVVSTGTAPQVTVDSVKSFAGNNLLTVSETHDAIRMNMISEEDFKKVCKQSLSAALSLEVTKKTKFTMLRDPVSHTVRTKASVYVFSEEDLRLFIEKIISYR